MPGTVLLTSPVTPDDPVWTRKFVFSFAAGLNDEVSKTFKINGILQKITVAGNASAIGIRHLTKVVSAGVTLLTVDVTTSATPEQRNLHEPLSGEVTVSMQPIGNSPAAHTVTVYLRGIV